MEFRNNYREDLKNYSLEDLLDINFFQKLQDSLDELYSLPCAIVDKEGKILTATSWNDICSQFHRNNPLCAKDCLESEKYMQDKLRMADLAVIHTCKYGFTRSAMPIIIKGHYMAKLVTGQFFMKKP
ncbi:MAG TPA: PocR ligand-binding domain-containing protein, partial [Bacteroidales bacterium]|nr:PocR ligand-binding domain-containing protein [Bacteroidales bacterium]